MHEVFEEQGHFASRSSGSASSSSRRCWRTRRRSGRAGPAGSTNAGPRRLDLLSSVHPPRRESSGGEKADIVVYGVPAWSPYATFAKMNPVLTLISSALGYLGGYIEALGKPGCSVIIATPCPEQWDMEHHPSYKEVWERVLPATKDPYAITERFGEEFATHAGYIEQYRNGVAFHPVHGILATHPLKRMQHAARVYVAGADDPAVPKHVGFIPTATVEDAIAEAESIHGTDASIVCVRNPGG